MRIRTRYPTQQQQQTNKFSENFPLKEGKIIISLAGFGRKPRLQQVEKVFPRFE